MNDKVRWFGIRALALTIACAVSVLAVYSYVPEFMVQQATVGAVGLTLVVGLSIVGTQWRKGRNQPQTLNRYEDSPAPTDDPHDWNDPEHQMSADDLLERYQSQSEPNRQTQPTQEVIRRREPPANGKSNEEQVKDQLAKMVMETISKSKLEISMTGTIDEATFSPQVKKMKFKLTPQEPEAKPAPEKPKPKEEKKPVLRRQA